jgi:hypothetical protein
MIKSKSFLRRMPPDQIIRDDSAASMLAEQQGHHCRHIQQS